MQDRTLRDVNESDVIPNFTYGDLGQVTQQSFDNGKRAGVKAVVDYFSRHWMGQTRGMMLYEIPAKDRDSLEDGIIPEEVR